MQEMLDNEDCDAIFEPSCIVEFEASNPKNCDSSDTAKYTHQAGERVYNMNFAAGVSLSRPGVARALSSIISCLRSEGFFDDLYEKYFEQRGCKNSLEKYNRGQGALQYQHFLGLFVFVFIASLVLMATARDLPWMGGRHVTVSPDQRFRDRSRKGNRRRRRKKKGTKAKGRSSTKRGALQEVEGATAAGADGNDDGPSGELATVLGDEDADGYFPGLDGPDGDAAVAAPAPGSGLRHRLATPAGAARTVVRMHGWGKQPVAALRNT